MNYDEIMGHLERMFYRVCELEERVQELETKTASDLSQPVVAESETSEEGYVPTVDDFFYNPEEENSEKPNNQDAFTELRAKLKELENEQFNDSWDDGVRYAVNKIREVIE